MNSLTITFFDFFQDISTKSEETLANKLIINILSFISRENSAQKINCNQPKNCLFTFCLIYDKH